MDNKAGSLDGLVRSWQKSLRARNLSPRTVVTYVESATQLVDFLAADRRPLDPKGIRRDDITDFVAHLAETRSASTASVRYRALQQFFAWMVDEEEIAKSPMERMKAPLVPEKPVPVLSEDQVRRLLGTAKGPDFVSRRDAAILRLFLNTGMRLNELVRLTVDSIDPDDDVAVVMGKGRRPRACPFDPRTAQAVDRYLRLRRRHRFADADALWLGEKGKGPMGDSGIGGVVRRRGEQAGIDGLHPHALRHAWAHAIRMAGMGDDELMRLAGWKSRQMLNRYGASVADERARDAYRRHLPWAKL